MEVKNTPKKQIYKGANPTSILNHEKRIQKDVKRTITNNFNSNIQTKIKKHIKVNFSDFRVLSPKNTLKNVKKMNNFDEKNFDDSIKLNNILGSPYHKYDYNINYELFQKNMSPMIHAKKSNESIIRKNEKKDNNKQLKHEIKVKKVFYFLTASIYFSLYLLCLKILFNLPISIIPPLGTSLFIISFNNVVLSILFIILDQIDYSEYLSFKRVLNNFPKVIIKELPRTSKYTTLVYTDELYNYGLEINVYAIQNGNLASATIGDEIARWVEKFFKEIYRMTVKVSRDVPNSDTSVYRNLIQVRCLIDTKYRDKLVLLPIYE